MTETVSTGIRITDLRMLKPGDIVEARRGDVVHHRDRVDSVAPDLGVAWITEALPGYRRIIDTEEYALWLRPDGDAA
jgi:hypothetical protein